jgi:hypothetical protein
LTLQILKFQPGIVKDITEYSAGKNGPFWVDGDLVRFRNGYPTKIGGWQKEIIYGLDESGAQTDTEVTLQGVCRNMIPWRGLDGTDRIAIGSHNHLYIFENGLLYDVTPLRKTSTNLSNPIATSNGSTTVTITDNSHGAVVGDWVVLDDATATGGLTTAILNSYQGHQITAVTTNTFTFTASSAASSTVSSGGGTGVDVKYLIGDAAGLGNQTGDPALGWGVGAWGDSTWGTPRNASTDPTISLEGSAWSLSLWGEDLLATVRNGTSYVWDLSDGTNTRATLVSAESGAGGVPTKSLVTSISFPDRHFVCAGADPYVAASGASSGTMDPMLVRWSTQEDFAVWGPTATNTAGDQRLQIGTKIIAMSSAREETIIATDEAIYGMTFVGAPFTFSFRLLASNCGALGINVMMNVDGDVYWMGKRNFFMYNGSVQEIPCPVQHYVFDRMQLNYVDKIIVGHNKKFKEVTWFYVSTSVEGAEPESDSYVTYNYFEQTWTIGSLGRTAWSDSFGFRSVPFAFDSSGVLYNHETGTSDNGSAMNAYIESSPREMSESGENLFLVDKIIPDVTLTANTNLYVQLNTRKYPNATEITKGPFTITSSTTKLSTRAKGRQMSMKLYSSGSTDEWSLGDFRINSIKDSLR